MPQPACPLWLKIVLIAVGLIPILISHQAYAVATESELRGSRPNVILVITDDQGYAPLGRVGHPWIQTPNLDQLYDQSTRFDRFLVSPTCAPTRSALMTGRHPMKNGVTHTILERERMTLDAVTLPETLKKVGYTSAIFGKWHLGDEDAYQPNARGFDESFIHGAGGIGQAYNCSCADAPGNKYFDPVIRHNGTFVQTKGFCTDVFFDAAIDWIETTSRKDSPFFAYIATNAPHSPYIAPEKNAKRFLDLGLSEGESGFYGMIENIDENMGRLAKAMARLNLEKNTILIFMSDNGSAGNGLGRIGKAIGTTPDGKKLVAYNAGMKGTKGSPDEGGVRVPFLVRWDDKIQAGNQVDQIAAHIDLFPTLADFAGAELPTGQVEGRSLLSLIADPDATWDDRYLVTHCGRWPTGAEPNDFQYKKFAIRNQRYRFVDNSQLFDMQSDPGQTQNVIESHPEVVAAMRKA
ncbi:arylsulfatase [Neorhodopirellula pilleata]|uniref:Arylsulfatase n=1 Tax=Neorhodopirellula pilleata TaxID=2714738 RepID=A0A5C6AVM7_9BACT|nr:arylsulfatase [Neorhodopirellula pilleata]TWU03648.1 Arylsulfatase [Neorhodopirellula pilleata]